MSRIGSPLRSLGMGFNWRCSRRATPTLTPVALPFRSSKPLSHLGSFRASSIQRLAPQADNEVEGSTDIAHSTFISSASPSSDFNPDQQPSAGTTSLASSSLHGRLSPTSSHLFKLVVPLPTSLTSSRPPAQPTAFLLHPSQPLSHLSRLIAGSLPPSERNADVQFLALTGREGDVDQHLRSAEEERDDEKRNQSASERYDGGPFLGERSKQAGRFQEVSWSLSTDLSDFIKQSCLNERFKIIIKPEPQGDREDRELTLEVTIPSFASRTTYLRQRLLKLTKELDSMTKKKKSIDYMAHKGVQRLAVVALGAGVSYWIAVIRWTFFTDAGWDVMEPVTWATGFATLLGGCAFLVYHNREVSYSSLLDLSITARQKRLYDQHGLDVEKWTEIVSEAKSLRKEIARVAADYDLEWKGELENLSDSRPLESRLTSGSSSRPQSTEPSGQTSSQRNASRDVGNGGVVGEGGEKIDINKTIDEASELASQSEERRSKEKAAQRKGEVVDTNQEEEKEEEESMRRGKERAKTLAKE